MGSRRDDDLLARVNEHVTFEESRRIMEEEMSKGGSSQEIAVRVQRRYLSMLREKGIPVRDPWGEHE